MSNFVGYKPSPLSILVQGAKNIFKSRGKNPTPGTINTVPIAKNLTTKRNIQDKVVAAVDKGVKAANVPPSLRGTQSASKMKKEKSKELKDYSYTADKYENKAKGGRVGLKFGSKKKSNIQKIKETFGPGSSNPKKSAAKKKKSFPDLNKDGKVTFADILKGRGVKRG
jgi:hypothetical protein